MADKQTDRFLSEMVDLFTIFGEKFKSYIWKCSALVLSSCSRPVLYVVMPKQTDMFLGELINSSAMVGEKLEIYTTEMTGNTLKGKFAQNRPLQIVDIFK